MQTTAGPIPEILGLRLRYERLDGLHDGVDSLLVGRDAHVLSGDADKLDVG